MRVGGVGYIGVPGGDEGGFRPPGIGGCILWLRADMGITLNGSDVSAWADQSGNGNDADQTTPADQPAYEASGGPNSKPCVTFDSGNTEYMNIAGMTDASNDYTIFAVINELDGSAGVTENIFSTSTTNSHYGTNRTGDVAMFDGAVWRTGMACMTGEQILCWRLDSGSLAMDFWRDGTKLGSAAYDGNDVIGNTVYLGTGQGPLNYVDAKVAEFIIYNRKLNSAELALVHAYLSSRYGIEFSITSSIANCFLHLDAALGITLNGSDVSAWADQSGSSNDFAQATPANQPAYSSSDSNISGLFSVWRPPFINE